MKLKYIILAASMLGMLACSCAGKAPSDAVSTNKYVKLSPNFDGDSAYYFVKKQVDFGSRVVNSPQHRACGDYLVAELKRFGADVVEQKADLKAYDGTVLKSRNIIGSYNTSNPNRLLLFAHWDSRPFSDHDADESKHHTPVEGANDGASGVGVLLEMARLFQLQAPQIGVDIVFFDAEDYGDPNFANNVPPGQWWCLGSQYWSKTPHVSNYTARFGILLDMVGGVDARFYKEATSLEYAMGVVDNVWTTARNLGYGKYFVDKNGTGVTDDHTAVNQVRRIPSIDIIQLDPNTPSGFAWYWHTSKDNMDSVSKETLKAVGQTVLEVVYKEK